MKKQWVVVSALAVVVLGSWVWFNVNTSHAQTSTGHAPPEVTVAQVLSREITDSAEFTGRVQAVNTVKVRPRVGGYVDSVTFKEGAAVHKGDVLFRIDPRPFQAEVDRLAAQRNEARAALKLARDNASRAKRLLAKHAISKADADRQSTAARSAQAKVAAADAALASAQLNLGFTKVRAPIDGRVSDIRVTPGNLVDSHDVLTSVVSVNPVHVSFDVDEQSWLKFDRLRAKAREEGHAAHIGVAMELSDESGYPHAGWLDFVDNQLHTTSGTIRLRAVFANYDGLFTPGLYARVRLRSGAPKSRLLIDDRAVGTDLGNQFVYVVDKNHKVQYRRIQTGPLVDGLRVIESGLKAGSVVVVNGLQRVRPGAQVKSQQVAMTYRLDAQNKALVEALAPVSNGAKMTQAEYATAVRSSMAFLAGAKGHGSCDVAPR